MKFKSLLAAGIALFVLSTEAYAEDQVLIAPPPEWVAVPPAKSASLAPAAEAQEDMPVRVVDVDYQIRLEPDRQSIYTAMAIKFLTPQGLSAGNISLPWQPGNDTMTVHSVRIRRGNELIDVLEEGQTFSVLRREQSLEIATLNGVLTANMFPAGLEVGDILELAYTVTSSHPVLKGHAESMVIGLNMPKDRVHVLIEWPEKHPIRLSQSYGLPEWQRSRRKGFEVAEITLENVEPIIPPRLAPSRYGILRLIEATDFASWSQVAGLFTPLYDEASKIPSDGRLRQEVENIRATSEDPLKRAELALDLVQDKIRYVALAMGVGGLQPATASDTWSRRFGDCKAKTALLLGLLREFGIEAEPVLVSSVGGDAIPGRLPMVGVFDHVLVRAVIDGREYWLDGTRSGDGALADLRVPAFEWGLPVRASGSDLVRMMPGPLDRPEEDLAIRIDASAGLRLPALAEFRLVTRGDTALGFNAALSSMTGNVRKEALERYWRDRFDFVKPDKVDMQFDQATGELVLTLTGKAQMEWERFRYEADGMGVGYSADFSRSDGPNKEAPFATPHPFFDRTVETIILPPGFSEKELEGKAISEILAGVEYRREASIADSVFTATLTRRSLVSEFPASEADAAAKRLKALADEAVYIRIPFNYQSDAAEREHILTQYEVDANGRIGRGNDLMSLGRYEEALADFDKAANLSPDNAWAWANKAVAQVWLRDFAGAKASLERAAKIDENNPVVLRGQGMIAQHEGDFPKAIAAFRRSLEKEPEFGYAHYSLAHILFNGGEYEEALAEVEQAIELSPGFVAQYPLHADVLMALKRKEDATRATDKMLATFPRNPLILGYASNFYEFIGEYDKAEHARKLSLDVPPTAAILLERANRRPVAETDKKLAELDEALRLDPNFVPALISRGNVLWMEYEYKRALTDVNKAIELAPTAWLAYDVKAKILADTNRRKEAAAVAEQAIDANPDNPAVYRMVAYIYERLGMAGQAQSVRDRQQKLALQSEPEVDEETCAAGC